VQPSTPAYGVENRIGIFERKIKMAGGMPLESRYLAAHAHMLEAILERALEKGR
jgi:hypothetical protein